MTITIDILKSELGGKPHWLAKPKVELDREAIRARERAKHRAAHLAKPIAPNPVRPETMAMLTATYEAAKAKDPVFHPDTIAFRRHRRRTHMLPLADVHGENEAGAWARHRTRHRIQLLFVTAELPEEPITISRKIAVKTQLAIWAKALKIIDITEVVVRDLIERDLSGKTGEFAAHRPLRALEIAGRLLAKVAVVRENGIKAAFRMLRSRLGNALILDVSLAAWARYFAKLDVQAIGEAVQTGLVEGLDNTEIARRVIGSMSLNGVDGVTERTRHKIAHLGRAAIKQSNLRKDGLDPAGQALRSQRGLEP